MAEAETTLIKGGDTIIRASIRRTINGHHLDIWAHPVIEDYFSRQAEGKTGTVAEQARNWIRRTGSSAMEFYKAPTPQGPIEFVGGHYRLDAIGGKLFQTPEESGVPGGVYNLSFLKLVGISQGAGVGFDFKHVGTDEGLEKLAKSIRDAAKAFYINNLRPVDYTVTVNIQSTN